MGKRKVMVSVDQSKCAPCSGLVCVGVCPLGILEEGSDGKPRISDAVSCNFCRVCVNLCPMRAISVTSGNLSE
jgi:NAD-dependent dihydropyrimidine dehydrogenase PreA subunit